MIRSFSNMRPLVSKLFLFGLMFAGIVISAYYFLTPKSTYQIKYFRPIKHIEGFQNPASGDSLYFDYLTGIAQDSLHNFYISDASNNQILKLDSTLKFIKAIGKSGQGPGEFLGPREIVIHKGLIYVNDAGNGRIQILDMEGNCQKSFRPFSPLGLTNFAVNSNGLIYTNTPGKDSLVTIYNHEGKEVSSFGRKYNFPGQLEYRNNIAFITIDSRDNSYLVFKCIPKIRKYDKKGRLVWEKDVSKFPEVREMIKRIKKKKKTNNRVMYVLTTDVRIGRADNLYILYVSPIPPYGPYGRNPYEFDTTTGKLKTIYRLSHPNEEREDISTHFVFFNQNRRLLCCDGSRLILFAPQRI